jgi:hypothetical protein
MRYAHASVKQAVISPSALLLGRRLILNEARRDCSAWQPDGVTWLP